MRLSIVIPACNEEQRIGSMLDAYLPFFAERYGDDVEFITVINGSTDATEDVVSGYKSEHSQLRSIIEPGRIGKGGALIGGFEAAEGDLIGFVDADGSTPPEAFQDLVEKAETEKLDGAIASRWIKGSDVSPKQPFIRQVTSRIFNICIKMLFGLRFTDTQCGAKVFRRGPLMAVLPHLGITRWAFDVDLLFQFRRCKAQVTEYPTTWRDVEGSKLAVTEASVEMLLALVRLRLMYSPFGWIVRFYDRYLLRIIPAPQP